MKAMRQIINILVIALLMTSCVNEIISFDPTPGKDVKFSISAKRDALTKTLYGAEGKNSIDVNWVSGDLVTIYGTTCAVNQADYSVTPVLSEGGDPTNVAAELNKKGAAGVQWGASEYSDFYAVYPAATGAMQPIKADNGDVIGVKVPTSISDTQYNQFTLQGDTWVGVPYDSESKSLNMENALMYAYNIGTGGTGVTNGSSSVPLVFQPFSTVLKFRISSWEGISLEGNEFRPTASDAIILRSIKLTAPNKTYAIAGGFDLELQKQNRNGTLDVVANVNAPTKGSDNTITVVPTTQVEWNYGASIEFSVFTIPVSDRDLAKETWAVTIDTSEGVKTLELTPNVEELPLTAGSIHKMLLPGIPVKTKWTYSEKDWVTNVPRNIYLSELSVPGAWSCVAGSNGDVSTSEQYQQDATIKDLYDAGVRAFHIDCRLSPESIRWGSASGDNRLVVAGTEILNFLGTYSNAGTEVLGILQSISNQIGKGEYAVAVLTIAESRLDNKHGSVEPLEVLAAIKGILNSDNITNLYTGEIDANTTVNDVLNKLIVKINVNTNDINFVGKSALPSYALVSEASLATSDGSNGSLIKKGVFTKMNSSPIYWSTNTTSDLTYYYHQAQGTAGTNQPTYAERKAAIDSIVLRSQRVYSANKHNAWYQIAIGGYQKSNGDKASLVARELNPYLRSWITKKMNKETVTVNTADGKTETVQLDCSPLGIVLMNFANQKEGSDYQSYELIKDIIDMNGKFYLSRNPNQEPWPSE